ncbi:MAG TPA: sigma-70 family RNA polymerase sigma factor [Marmoricola sp.]|nr:sigma-70 family RNA polymerase sigma factor [Marmoricola sp.]
MHGTTGDPSPVSGPAPGPGALWDDAAAAFGRWRGGDRQGLDDLVRLMSPVLWHVVRATGLEREAAEDVVQTTWLALVRSADAVHDPQAVGRWLCTSARREAWRSARTSGRVRTTDDEVLDARLPQQESPEHDVVLDDERARLWQALSRLPERCQRLLRIVATEPRPDYTSISADLQMPVGSIGPTRGRCLAKLRSELVATGGLT